jgi:outer membrane protein TolC
LTDELTYSPVELPDPARSTETARAQRHEVRAQSLRELSARRNADAAWSDRLPSLAAFGDYGVIGTSFATGLPTRSVGIKLTIPIYDGGRRDARRAEANSLLRQERIRSEDTARQVEFEVRTSIESLRAADELVKAASETLRLSEKELEQAQRRFEAGVASGLEVTDAQTRLARARESNVAALFRHMSARIDYGLATGALDSVLTQ